MGGEVPAEPIIFIKPNTSVIGPDDLIQWPRASERIDHEAELAVVISKICKEVPRAKAKDVIFGYTVANDVPTIIEFVTSVMTLLPGDVILTGTPSGIGPMVAGGDVVITIEGLGSLRNKVSARG